MYYYLILALQAFCVYHVFKNKREYYWIFLILFLPVIGCIIYLITQVYNKKDAATIQNEITTMINPSKRIHDLQKQLAFSDTFQNRVNLADAYFEMKDYKNAASQYEEAIETSFQNDEYVLKQLINTYANLEDFDKVIAYTQRIKDKSKLRGTREQFLYGMALYKKELFEEAKIQLEQINISSSNYEERVAYAKLLLDSNKKDEAKEILEEIYEESKHMISNNKRKYRSLIQEVKQLLGSI